MMSRYRSIAIRVAMFALVLGLSAWSSGWAAGAGQAGGSSPAQPGELDLGDDTIPAPLPGAPPSATAPSNAHERELLEKAEKGDAVAQLNLGVLYIIGKEVPRNLTEGARWMREAAEKGNVIAEVNMGALANGGVGIPQDYHEAARWWQMAADQGNARAETHLGYLYEHGLGVVENFSEALRLYQKAVDQNSGVAETNMATMVEKGEGTPIDMDRAIRLLKSASNKGVPGAQMLLSSHYLSGKGVPKDAGRAYFWAVISASRARANLAPVASVVRTMAEKQLKPDDIAKIQELAGHWQPGADSDALLVALPIPPFDPEVGNNGLAGAHSIGSGFLVSGDGMVLTNAHVANECQATKVRTPDQVLHPAKVLSRDTHVDLALLKIDGAFSHVASFRDDRGIRQGDSVMIYGFPLAGLLSDKGNVTLGTVSALAGLGNDSSRLQISAPVQPGNSGGPLVDSSGNVVGVVVAKLNVVSVAQVTGDMAQNVNFAIKENVARDFLDANNVNYGTAKSAREIKPADLAERIKEFTVLVTCE